MTNIYGGTVNDTDLKTDISKKYLIHRTLFGIAILAALYIVSRHNYLVFHTLAEFFSIAVAWSLFLVFWNTRGIIENKSLILLGVAYLFIGSIDLMHTLSYKGMGVLGPETGANPATQLWIFARYMESFTLCVFASMMINEVNAGRVILFFSAVISLGLLSIFYWENFPVCYIDGVGLTKFKVFSEYLICAILILALLLLKINKTFLDEIVYRSMVTAIILTMFAELAFTFYVGVYGLSNLLGHYFKIVSFYFVYRALIRSGLRRPHLLLYDRTKESEYRFKKFFENSGVYGYQISKGGTIIDVNNTALSALGYSRDDLVGKPLFRIYTDESIKKAKGYFQEWKTSGHLHNAELSIKTKDGKTRWVILNADSVRDNQGNILHSTSVQVDITDRKKMEERLHFLSAITEGVTDGIIVTNTNFEIIYANQAAEKLFGYTFDELEGKSPDIFNADPETASVQQAIYDTLKKGEAYYGESLNRRKDGTMFHCGYKVMPLRNKHGEIDSYVGVQRDISDRKKLEKQIQQAQKMESIGNLAGGIAHDFNNILFPIIAMAEMLLEDLPNGSIEMENAEEILIAGKRGRDLVKQILAFSRQSEHKMIPTRIQNVIEEVINLSRSTIPTYIEIKKDIQADCGMVMADPTQIHQVSMNLITNAYHALEDHGGTITVKLKQEKMKDSLSKIGLEPGHYALLSFSDTGNGIPSELTEKIFEPYFTTKEQAKGTGLGLAVVYGIVKEHQGNIKIYSKIGKGTTFNVYLPLLKRPVETKTINASKSYPGGNERILVVDDEKPVAKLEKQMLERMGYKITVRLHSKEAYQAFKANPDDFNLVITDMTMPIMTGSQLAEKILAIRPEIPIIVCTGFSEMIDKDMAEAIGIKGFLMKPVVRSKMAEAVRKVLDD